MTRNERLQRKRLLIAVIVVLVVTIAAVAVLMTTICRQIRENRMPEVDICTREEWEASHPQKPTEPDCEDPAESDKIAAAVIATIGTGREEECFGYNATFVLKMLTAECGDDGDLCWAVATAIFNETVKLGNRYTPVDVINGNNDAKYHLTAEPADFISEAALTYFCKVFVRCDLCPDIGKATMFYNPALMTEVPSHEKQHYVTTISGVRFFEELA